MPDVLDAVLVSIVVLGGAVLHLMLRSATLASATTALLCIGAAAVYFDRTVPTGGGAPMTGIAIFTIGVVSFVAASITGIAARWVRTRLRGPRPK